MERWETSALCHRNVFALFVSVPVATPATSSTSDCRLPRWSQGLCSGHWWGLAPQVQVLVLRLLGFGARGPRRVEASYSVPLLQWQATHVSTAVSLPRSHCLITVGPSQFRELVWSEQIVFQVNLHYQLPEITDHCCCVTASARSRQMMWKAGNELWWQNCSPLAVKLHLQYFCRIPQQIQIRIFARSKRIFFSFKHQNFFQWN